MREIGKNMYIYEYGSDMTVALVRQKLADRGTGVKGVTLIEVSDGDTMKAGCFEVEFIHSNYSIADANDLAIRTPADIVFQSGDFKIDHTPVNSKALDRIKVVPLTIPDIP